MEQDRIRKMVADLEILAAFEKKDRKASSPSPENPPEGGAGYLLKSSPGKPSPARVLTDRAGLVIAANPEFSELSGFAAGEIRGQKPGSFLQGGETEPEAVEIIRKAVRNGLPCTTEMFNYRKDGTRYRVRIQIEPLRDDAGELIGFEAVETKLE